jgi:putative DNA primase/helicase
LDHQWRFDHTAGKWHHWDGVRWAPDTTEKARHTVAKLAADALLETLNESGKKVLTRLLSLPAIDRALDALATFPDYATDGADWDQIPYLLGCKNGVVDLRTNTLIRKPDPTCLVTQTTHRMFNPINHPSEFADRAPRFMEFMVEITSGDPEMITYLLKWFGASLFGFSPEQRFLLMIGIGRNGKGVLKHTVIKAVGEYGQQFDANLYMRSKLGAARSDGARADLMALKGKRITFFSEPEGNRFNEEMLKAHTGGDVISARALYSNNIVSWEPTHSITFLTNEAPDVDDLGPSMAARVMVADFLERFDGVKQDRKLPDKLAGEADGVLAILCYFARDWWDEYERAGEGISLPSRVVSASKAFMERNDVVAAVIDDAFEIDPGARTPSTRLYEAYLQWHARSDRTDEAISQVRFSQALERKGFKKEKTRAGMVYVGLHPLNAWQLADKEGDA